MPPKNKDLYGSAPDQCKVAVLIIDMINDFDFEDGEELFRNALPIASKIFELKKKARNKNIPVLYVNDNFGKWKSDFKVLIDHCIADNTKGKEIAEILRPEKEDYFVLKPKHSGFFSTTLDILLEYLNVETLILTGITTDICVLFTANDAYMRDFKIVVPSDCVAAVTARQHESALHIIQRVVKGEVDLLANIDLNKYL